MKQVRSWLAERRPPPPGPLARWLDGVELSGDTVPEALVYGGLRELSRARAEPGRVRKSAFHLLAADALITYGCEAALETEAPAVELQRILGLVAAPGS
jgi:hypothetical protein